MLNGQPVPKFNRVSGYFSDDDDQNDHGWLEPTDEYGEHVITASARPVHRQNAGANGRGQRCPRPHHFPQLGIDGRFRRGPRVGAALATRIGVSACASIGCGGAPSD